MGFDGETWFFGFFFAFSPQDTVVQLFVVLHSLVEKNTEY